MANRHRFVGLDGLRGVAAICVAILHLKYVFHLDFDLPNAPLAVDFFFLLSGFVLAHGYSQKLADGGVADYLVARARRLFPLIVLGTVTAGAALIALGYDRHLIFHLAGFGALSLPYLKAVPFSPSIAPLNPPAWSLFFEIVASLAFGLGLWRGRNAGFAVAAGVIAMVAVLVFAGEVHVGHDRAGFWFGFARVAFGFGLGTWLYKAPIDVPPLPIASLALILGAVLLSPFGSPLLQAWFVFVLFPFVVLSAAKSTKAARASEFAGGISYPLYIMHWPTYLWISVFLRVHGFVSGTVAFLSACGVAIAVGKLYDEPVRHFLATASARRQLARAL